MNARILNRDFKHPADGWYMIEPRGEHPNRAAKVIQVIDADASAAIVNRFNGDADAGKLSHGHEMLIDHEHFKHDLDKETRAYGWLTRLQNREDGIYGQVRWTTTGKAAVDGGDYRFFSTEYDPADVKILNSGAVKQVRPLRLDGLTLTNNPNNKGGRPITNRNEDFRRGTVPSADEPTQRTNTMKSIATRLGLSAEASEDAILAEVTKLFNRAETAEGQLAPLKNRNTELEGVNVTLLDEQVDALLDAHGVKEAKLRNRLKPALIPLKNREDRVGFLVDLGHKAGTAKPAVVLNRDQGRTPGQEETPATDDAAALAQKVEAEIQTYKITNRCSYEQASRHVMLTKPELFGGRN